ncbi:SMP-30/gluconolactonase/LRE family protein [Sulfitobacter porphyrae]|uniref:SMP-30/gluconolactonase/LRE family protein n=1 Tax=Sulfitobacter porphyrae TaxID=1246864 RepID=A0ABW2B5D4_9RHOB|nr:Smp-30/Cgr1 family protein [Sulfitobacter porphyrae]
MTNHIKTVTATRVSQKPDLLGESPVWDDRSGRLWWVDGVAKMIRYFEPANDVHGDIEVPSFVGSIGLTEEGNLVAGLADGIYLIDVETGAATALHVPDKANERMRFNDGKVDRQGRFVCGGMGVFAEPVGELIRVTSAGEARMLANGIRISNALCFSPDGKTMYFADSLDRMVRAYNYCEGEEVLTEPRMLVDTRQFASGPDGATVDSDGCIWVALVQAGKIARFTPEGKLDSLVEAPTDMPTCMCFGGPDLKTLYVTSIKDSGSGRAISRHPFGGHLFAIEGLGATGLPEPRLGQGL